jgi:chemotaxis protein methyltransferase CheR
MEISDIEFGLLKEFLLRKTGIDIAEEKKYLFTTRLKDLLKNEGCRTFSDFYNLLISEKNKNLVHQVIELMTTHESGFFRDEHPFKTFTENILPRVSKRRAEQALFLPPRLRILSAGCSFGQEPYSIALCIQRWLPTQSVFTQQNIVIMGIDISAITIERAKKGIFSELEIGKQISSQERHKYFNKCGGRWQLCEEIRRMVVFQQANLIKPFDNMGKFDVIFCRNVIIYFSVEGKKTVLENLRQALEPEGILFLGSAESMYNLSTDFPSHNEGRTMYYTVN